MPDKPLDSPAPCGSFKLHYFPTIPMGRESAAPSDRSERSDGFRCFQSAGHGGVGGEGGSGAVTADDLAAMEARAREREQAAHARGYAEGEKAGVDMGRQAVEPVLVQMRNALVELEKLKKQMAARAEAEAVILALAVSRKIVRQEIRTDPAVVGNTIRAALEKVVDRDRIRIRLHPGDLEAMQGAAEEFGLPADGTDAVCFEPDAGLEPGGCLVETQFGDIDARIENQTQWLEERFLAELKKTTGNTTGKGS